jgi:hypothetical protein
MGYHFTGINPQTGIPSFSTVKGTDTIGPSFSTDRFFIGKMTPDYYGGLSNTMAYKNFRLDFLFQFVKQQGWSPTFWPGYNNTELKDGLNRWQKPGDITNIPRAATMQVSGPATTAVTPYLSSDQFWGDASYIRLKNIEISYTLPVKVLNKIKARTWRFYTQMQNLLTFTNYKGADPEIPSQSLTISNIRTIIIGTQLSF